MTVERRKLVVKEKRTKKIGKRQNKCEEAIQRQILESERKMEIMNEKTKDQMKKMKQNQKT